MNPADALALISAWLIAGLLVARCSGINQRLEPTMPSLRPADISEAIEAAQAAMNRIERACLLVLSGEITQAEAREDLERAYSALANYTSLVVAYAGTLTTPPPYYPGDLIPMLRKAGAGAANAQSSPRAD
jgi:hypothetical protein